MSFLFGSPPSVSSTTVPTINPTQTGAQQFLYNNFATGAPPAGASYSPGAAYAPQTFAAPLSPLQTSSVAGLQSLSDAAGVSPQQAQTGVNTLDTLNAAFGYQAPQVATPTATGTGAPVNAQQITAPTIDATNAFNQGVVQPLTQNFEQQIIPTVLGNAGRSAGGAYSSDTQLAEGFATQNLNQTLADVGAQYQLAADTANQQAALTTGTANQAADLSAQQSNQAAANQVALANLSSALSTNQLNTGANLQGQGLVNQAVGQAPSVISTPQAPQISTANLLTGTLAGGAVPQATEQAQLSGQYQDYINQQNQSLALEQLLAGFGTSPTQQTNTVVTPATTGLIQSLLGGLSTGAGAAGTTAAIKAFA